MLSPNDKNQTQVQNKPLFELVQIEHCELVLNWYASILIVFKMFWIYIGQKSKFITEKSFLNPSKTVWTRPKIVLDLKKEKASEFRNLPVSPISIATAILSQIQGSDGPLGFSQAARQNIWMKSGTLTSCLGPKK